ncbi:MAG: hypothetical protein ACFBSE_26755 [Prochloraceae cyanobacterium]
MELEPKNTNPEEDLPSIKNFPEAKQLSKERKEELELKLQLQRQKDNKQILITLIIVWSGLVIFSLIFVGTTIVFQGDKQTATLFCFNFNIRY